MNRVLPSVLAIILCGLFSGCQPEPQLGVTVNGSVSIAGQPFKEGLITFVPVAQTTGPKVSVPIEQGAFEIAAENGLMPGQFRVEILGLPPGIKAMMAGQVVSHRETDYREIAGQYNSESILYCTLVAEQANTQNFEVQYRR